MSVTVGELVARLKGDTRQFDQSMAQSEKQVTKVTATVKQLDAGLKMSQRAINAYTRASHISAEEMKDVDSEYAKLTGEIQKMDAALQKMGRAHSAAIAEDQRRTQVLHTEALRMDAATNSLYTHNRAVVLAHGQALRMNAAFDAGNKAVGRAVPSLGRLNNVFQMLAIQATGVNPVIGRLGSTLGMFAIGGLQMTAVLAGLAAIGYAWNKLTEDTRRAKEQAKEYLEALRQARDTRSGTGLADQWVAARDAVEKLEEKIAGSQPGSARRAKLVAELSEARGLLAEAERLIHESTTHKRTPSLGGLSANQLAAAQEATARQAETLRGNIALATTTEEAAELNNQLRSVQETWRLLNGEIARRGDDLPAVIDEWNRGTRSAVDNMETEFTRLRDGLIQQWGEIPAAWRAVLVRMQSDIGVTNIFEQANEHLDALARKIADLRRANAGAGMFRDVAGEVQAIINGLEVTLGQTNQTSTQWTAIVGLLEQAKALLADMNAEGLTFTGRLSRSVSTIKNQLMSGEIFAQAIAGVLSSGISSVISGFMGMLKDGLFGPKYVSVIEENTRALKRLTGDTSELEAALLAVPEGFDDLRETLKDSIAAQRLRGSLDLARRKMAAADVDDPTGEFAILKQVLTQNLGGKLGKQVGGLNVESIDEFLKIMLAQISAGTFDVGALGRIPLDEFLDILGEMESLGDAAGEAAGELGVLASTVRNAPSGYRANLARYGAETPTETGGTDNSVTVEGDVIVVTDDPEEFGKKVRRQARRGGTTSLQLATGPGGHFVPGAL